MDARPANKPKRLGLLAQLGEFLRWLLLLTLVTATVASLGLYFVHSRLDQEIRLYLHNKFQNNYPQLIVQIRSAHRVEGSGIEVRGIAISEPSADGQPIPLVYVEEMFAECLTDLSELAAGRFSTKRLTFRGVKVRATRFPDGTWNLTRLLPLPKFGNTLPPVVVEGGFLEFVDLSGSTGRGTSIRDISLQLTPVAAREIAAEMESPPALQVRGSFAGDHLRRVSLQGQIDPGSGAWDLHGEVESLDLGPQTLNSLPEEIARQLAPLRAATGSTSLSFALEKLGPDAPLGYALSGKFVGRIDDPRLPQPLMNVRLPFDFSPRGLKIQDAFAQAGPTRLQFSAGLASLAENSPYAFRLKAEQVMLNEPLANSLSGSLRETWDKFLPQGIVDADVTVRYDGKKLKTSVLADLRDTSFAYYKFPYRVQHARGQLRFHDNLLEVDNIQASANGRLVRLKGKLNNPGPNVTGWLDLLVDEPLPLDDLLIGAIQGPGQQVVRSLSPQGLVRVSARFERPDLSMPPHRTMSVELLNCSMRYARFPYPLYNVTGKILMDDDDWTFANLEGYNDSAFVICRGSWRTIAKNDAVLTLDFHATDVPLEDELRDAFSDGARRFWQTLQPRGTIDQVNVSVRYAAATRDLDISISGEKRSAAGNIEGRSITIKPTWLPYQLDEVVGVIRFRNDVAELENVKGLHGNTSVGLSGRFESLPDEHWRLRIEDLNIDRLRASHELVSVLPQRLGQAIDKLKLQGPISMSGTFGMVGMLGVDQPLSSDWALDFDMEDSTVDFGVRLEHIRGGIHLAGSTGPHGHFSRGQLTVDSLFYKGIQLTHVNGPFSVEDQHISFGAQTHRRQSEQIPQPIRAVALGGTLVSSGRVWMNESNSFEVIGELFDGDLRRAINELAPSRPELSGEVFASVHLTGKGAGAHTIKGTGEIQLRKADIYELPVMVGLLKMVKVKRPDNTAFTSSDINFRIEADRIYFDHIDFNGDVINLRGRGEMTLDRAVNVTFTASVLAKDSPLDRLLQPVLGDNGGLFDVSVTGSVDDPLVTRNVNQALQQVFPESLPQPLMSRTPAPREVLDRLRIRR